MYFSKDRIMRYSFSPTDSVTKPSDEKPTEEIIATGLDTPWEIAFLPDNSMLVTERSGNLVHITKDKTKIEIPGVIETSEGGLLGMALHPNFNANKRIYFYYTTDTAGRTINTVESYKFENGELTDKKIIITNIPGSSNHDGGRIAFGPDNLLYITTGDAGNEESAQDSSALSGKILRLMDDGSVPADNPFGNAVYSFGHRNPQGLAWDSKGRLWSTEHGPSGFASGFDELNRIDKGKNYGWPVIQGDEEQNNMVSPIVNSGKKETWAPAGLAYFRNGFYFAGLRGQTLYKANLDDSGGYQSLSALLTGKYGRLRAVVAGPDDSLYISTSNTDGRGTPQTGDDKIIKLKF